MRGHLHVFTGPDQDRNFPLEEGQALVIGRGQNTGTQLNDLQVSRVHCELRVADGRFRLIDRGGAGGTLVNGRPITEREITPDDEIRIGATVLRLIPTNIHDQETVRSPASPAPSPRAAVAAGPSAPLTGSAVAHYEVGPLVAKGSNGTVYKARDTRDNRPVALKVLGPAYATGEEEFQRFVRAVKAVVGLRHENLVSVFGAGKIGATCWVAMEFVEGEPLTRVIERIGAANMLDWRYAMTVTVQVARALEAAHAQHVIHRNIAPKNILIRKGDGAAKLGDLILAKATEGMLARQVTRPGQLVGEIAYMAPERTRDDAAVDERSDLYGLGATVYALLTGRPPFEAGTLAETIARIRDAEPVKPKKYQLSIPDAFQDIVLKLLAKRPEDRYPDAAALLHDAERAAKFQGMTL